MTDIAEQIERWFAAHDDGEFARLPRTAPYTSIMPANGGRTTYTTKPRILVEAFSNSAQDRGLGLIGRYGLPNVADVAEIARFASAHPLLFLGDLDPPDLMIFAWLQARLGAGRIVYAGICDALLHGADLSARSPRRIALTASEAAALALVDVLLPDLDSLVGEHCARLLRGGEKLELEAIAPYLPEVLVRLVRLADPT